MKNIGEIFFAAFIFTFMLVSVFSMQSCGFVEFIDDRESLSGDGTKEYAEGENIGEDGESSSGAEIEAMMEPPTERVLEINHKYDELLSLNPDVVGYITIDNTIIKFPVLFNGDNDYYLKHDFYGNADKYGSVFMDMGNHGSILDRNTVIHGHNFGDGLIFNDLEKFKQEDFFRSTRIKFDNLYSNMEWEVFSVYVIHANDYFVRTSFTSDEEYLDFLTRAKEASMFQTDYVPSASDHILTLNTCSFEYDEAHTIIHAKLVSKTDNWQK